LRQALKPKTPKEREAINKEALRQERELWLREHPGKTAKDYRRASTTGDVVEWRKEKAKVDLDAERQAWERDHPGEWFKEHACGLSDADYVRYERWKARYEADRPKPAVTQ
jgi:hypothetical protein